MKRSDATQALVITVRLPLDTWDRLVLASGDAYPLDAIREAVINTFPEPVRDELHIRTHTV